MNANRKIMLSKSLFLNGLQCHKYLYLNKHHPDLKDEITASRETLFQSGTEVGFFAQKLFPGGVEMPHEGLTYSEQIKRTASEIEKGTSTIYEAAFSCNGVFARVDILHRGKNGWEIYEVKSSTEIKDTHLDDIAVQFYIVKGAGLAVVKVFLVHITKEYVRKGEIEVTKLFTIKDATDETVGKQDFILEEIIKQKEMLKGDLPTIDIGVHCFDPYECSFIGYCWQHIPANSVFDLKGKGANKFELYKQGILLIRDIPKELLSRQQKIQVEGVLEKKNIFNRERVKQFLDTI